LAGNYAGSRLGDVAALVGVDVAWILKQAGPRPLEERLRA